MDRETKNRIRRLLDELDRRAFQQGARPISDDYSRDDREADNRRIDDVKREIRRLLDEYLG